MNTADTGPVAINTHTEYTYTAENGERIVETLTPAQLSDDQRAFGPFGMLETAVASGRDINTAPYQSSIQVIRDIAASLPPGRQSYWTRELARLGVSA